MKISDFLSPDNVAVGVPSQDKDTLLRGLAARAAAKVKLNPESVAAELERRDQLGSTGIGKGVAIPHARFRELKRPFGLLACLQNPVEFEAVDGNGVDIVFVLLLPASSQMDCLNALAAVARKLRDSDTQQRLRTAPNATAAYTAITR